MATSTGERKLFRDSRLGILAGLVSTNAALGIVEWLGTVDFSTLPTWAATTAATLVGFGVNALTAWAAKRSPSVPSRPSSGASGTSSDAPYPN